MRQDETLNIDYYETQYEKWKADPTSVSPDWQHFFKGFEIAYAGTLEVPGNRSEARPPIRPKCRP